MAIENTIENAKQSVALVSDIIKIAGNTPEVKESGKNLGETVLTITKTINNVLLPLAAINFAFDKARIYFNEKFSQDFAEKTSTIPAEMLIEPKASIAGPALQGLAFTHEETHLKEMYLNLLATAMDKRVATNAHPSFVEIIRQMNADEALLIRDILKFEILPIVEIRLSEVKSGNYKILSKHQLNFIDNTTHLAVENTQLPAMIDNMIRLGFVDVNYLSHLTDEGIYNWTEIRPEIIRFRELYSSNLNQELKIKRGILRSTDFGKSFAKAVGLIEIKQ